MSSVSLNLNSSYDLLLKVSDLIKAIKSAGPISAASIPADIAALLADFPAIIADVSALAADEKSDPLLFAEGAVLGAIEVIKAVKS